MSGTEWSWNPETVMAVATATAALLASLAIWPVIEMRRDRHARLIRAVLADWSGIRNGVWRRVPDAETLRRLVKTVYDDDLPDATEKEKHELDEFLAVPDFMDDLGHLTRQRALHLEGVDRRLGATIIEEFKTWHKAISEAQVFYEHSFEDFVWLAGRIARRRGEDLPST